MKAGWALEREIVQLSSDAKSACGRLRHFLHLRSTNDAGFAALSGVGFAEPPAAADGQPRTRRRPFPGDALRFLFGARSVWSDASSAVRFRRGAHPGRF